MMLGHPIALVAQRLGVPREVGGIGQRLRHGAAFDDGHQIEQGEACHATADGDAPPLLQLEADRVAQRSADVRGQGGVIARVAPPE